MTQDDYMACDKCGAELIFIEEPKDSPHKFRAVCSKCRKKNGQRKFVAWVSWEQIEEIARLYPETKIETLDE